MAYVRSICQRFAQDASQTSECGSKLNHQKRRGFLGTFFLAHSQVAGASTLAEPREEVPVEDFELPIGKAIFGRDGNRGRRLFFF